MCFRRLRADDDQPDQAGVLVDWMSDASWNAFGLDFRVDSSDSELQAHLTRLFSGLPRAAAPEAARRVILPPLVATGQVSLGDTIVELVGEINVLAIAAAEGQLLFHAGAACRADGRTVVVCGPSGSGKSTLTSRLVEDGLAYLTDETVCVDPLSLRVTPFRKPMSVKPGAQQLLRHLQPDEAARRYTGDQWLIPPDALGGAEVPAAPLVPDLLIFPTYRRGAPLTLMPMSEARAAFELGQNSSRLSKVAGGALPGLTRLARRAPAYRLVHSDVDDATRAVMTAWDASP